MYLKMEYSYSMLFFMCFAVPIIFLEVIATSPRNPPSINTENTCTTPDNKPGNCVSVFRCKTYSDTYKRAWGDKASDKDKQVLKNAHCGSRPLDQRVCCENKAVSDVTKTLEKNKKKPCGRSIIKNAPHVIGGKNSILGAWPWMAALYQLNISSGITEFHCGGSLIASDWVLTAAHCIPTSPDVNLVHVRLGDLNIDENFDDNANPIEVEISNVKKHPEYMEGGLNDIALVRLREPVEFFDYIKPICLHGKQYATDATIYDNKLLTLAGWGKIDASHECAITHLFDVKLNTMPLEQCKKTEGRGAHKYKSVICSDASKKASCHGDSGGPFMFMGKHLTWSQAGIVSYGPTGCVQEDHPSVYTKVATFIGWIEKETGLKF